MRYSVNQSCVTHDRLQDEVIIINGAAGSYYSGSGTAADVWTLVSQGVSIPDAARRLAAEYSSDEDAVLRDVSACVASLVERSLLLERDTNLPGADPSLPEAVRTSWTPPNFDEYTDMWDLIKLDPIHDTDDIGWPVAKQ